MDTAWLEASGPTERAAGEISDRVLLMGQVSAAQEKGFAARSSDMSGGVQRLIPAFSKKMY